ncbi:hypothetical protein V6N13_000197 [Hibiscus sabdariffa]|uniref:Inositol polyphosphate multikinase n=2 Tax=Hibiscus sabdariffa TaxID=183260 RepID=A0ABR2AV18_9ROSI
METRVAKEKRFGRIEMCSNKNGIILNAACVLFHGKNMIRIRMPTALDAPIFDWGFSFKVDASPLFNHHSSPQNHQLAFLQASPGRRTRHQGAGLLSFVIFGHTASGPHPQILSCFLWQPTFGGLRWLRFTPPPSPARFASNHLDPSILDVKMGSRTWYPEASDDYIQRCLDKDRTTTTVSLGFRISGLQIYGNKESGFWKPSRKDVLNFTVDNVRLVLRKFVSFSVDSNTKPDCCFAHNVYGGPAGILEQLLELKTWFEDQTIYHFNSSSLLILFDKKSLWEGRTPFAEVKLIDFAHVEEGKGVIDHNFLGGLCSFIKFISEILTDLNESTTEGRFTEPEKKCFCNTP